MSETRQVALVGDFNPSVLAHQAIPQALLLAGQALGIQCNYQWLNSDSLRLEDLPAFDGIWCVPASPYNDMDAVLSVIRFAREQNVPFLGTCGGYQHAALEYARNVLGQFDAGNAEVDAHTRLPLISSLRCNLIEQSSVIRFLPHSMIASIYGDIQAEETYHCSYGVNQSYLPMFDTSDLRFSGYDQEGDPRVFELTTHPFFVGTAFQPERSAFNNQTHPLIQAFVRACINNKVLATQDSQHQLAAELATST